ncbi:DEAD/DEAH box helicase [Candidatus Cloacimonadota bacterium]
MHPVVYIDYDSVQHFAVINTGSVYYHEGWFQQVLRLLFDASDETDSDVSGKVCTPWWVFLSTMYDVGAILKVNNVIYTISESARELVIKSKSKQREFKTPSDNVIWSYVEINNRLESSGWNLLGRPLTDFQLRNVQKIASLTSAATFSVPGAGKTTEALAFFAITSLVDDKLLVVAPKNAFISWDEQLSICFNDPNITMTRLTGGQTSIKNLLESKAMYYIITYQQFPKVASEIGRFLSNNNCFMFLDESHRIKSGRGKVIADSILKIAHLPESKLIMSGTPMPQGEEDLIPQFEYLHPEIRPEVQTIIADFQPIFVRTTKAELNLPPVTRLKVPVPFNPAQKRLYDLMSSEVYRQAEQSISTGTRRSFRALGKSVIRLIEAVSNPMLLLKVLGFAHDDYLVDALNEGSAPKLEFACQRARQLAAQNRKCVIWTTFRENVETIAERLTDLNAVYIHGGVDTGEEGDIDTREGKIKRFKNDPNCYVLVANPAAASESISLHMICHHAIYVDRTYNAAHYLQSEDRIHRLGLGPDVNTIIEVLYCPCSIDENIHARLVQKVGRMATALNDSSLKIETIPYDIGDSPEDDIDLLDVEDIRSLLEWLKQNS